MPAADGGWSGAQLRARSPTPATGWCVETDGTTATTATSASWCWRCREQWLLLLQEQNKRGYHVNLTVLFNHIIPIITVIFFSAFDSRKFQVIFSRTYNPCTMCTIDFRCSINAQVFGRFRVLPGRKCLHPLKWEPGWFFF